MLTFNHKIYGNAELLQNTAFEVSTKPVAICYRLRGCSVVKHSSLVDAGLEKLDIDTLVEYGYAIKGEWNVVSFSDNDGVVTEYLATRRSLAYFRSETNPKMYTENVTMDHAFTVASDMNRILTVNEPS